MPNDITLIHRLIPELHRQGFRTRWGSKHLMVYPKDKSFEPIVIAGTPRDRHAKENNIKRLRKAGLQIKLLK